MSEHFDSRRHVTGHRGSGRPALPVGSIQAPNGLVIDAEVGFNINSSLFS